MTSTSCLSQTADRKELIFISGESIKTGAARIGSYIGLLKGKNVGVVANHTTLVNETHLVDTLLSLGVNVIRIFSPEHGFRGNADAGALVSDATDPFTGLPVISLYGKNKKPSTAQMEGLDIIVYDIQDVGVRFYTYLSTMTYVMEACTGLGVPLVVLDRPNPNGFYVDGPVLDTAFRSFAGLHPVPVVHGMTTGEFAMMINGEGWLEEGRKCDLTVVPVDGYEHSMVYRLPVNPSPNLRDWRAVYLYPTLGLFEGTIISVGRGTDKPFRVIGHPDFAPGSYVFTPESTSGATLPPYQGVHCYGQSLDGYAENITGNDKHFSLGFLIGYYRFFSGRDDFFNSYFDKLAGSSRLREQIMDGWTEDEIRRDWGKALEGFLEVRQKYLQYKDFP